MKRWMNVVVICVLAVGFTTEWVAIHQHRDRHRDHVEVNCVVPASICPKPD